MPTTTWKNIEQGVAAYFGGQRRGADFRKRVGVGGNNDIVLPGWSIEVKHTKNPTIGLIHKALEQAVRSRELHSDIVVAVIHRHGQALKESLTCMYSDSFVEHFGLPLGDGFVTAEYIDDRILYERIVRMIPVSMNKIPLLIVRKAGQRPIVVMRLQDFSDWFINNIQQGE